MSTTYTYSISTDFPNGFDSGALQVVIQADSLITTTLLSIDTSNDIIFIIFAATLSGPELTQLNLDIANFVLPPVDFPSFFSGIITLDSSSTSTTAIVINASNTSGGVSIASGTAGTTINTTGGISINSTTASNITSSALLSLSGETGLTIDSGADILIGNSSANSGVIQIGNTSTGKDILIGNSNSGGKVKLRWGGAGGYFIKHQEAATSLADSNATLTMDNATTTGLLNGILVGNPTLGRTLTLPTAALAIFNISGVQVGDSISFSVINSSSNILGSLTVVAGSGGNLVGNGLVSAVSVGNLTGTSSFVMRFNNVSSGSESYTVYRIA